MSSGKKNVPAAVPEGEIETWDAQNTEGKKGTETQVSIRFFFVASNVTFALFAASSS